MADIAVSPDGRRIVLPVAFDEVFQLYVRPLDSFDLTPVPGSEDAFQPFWSPDGRQIAFASQPSHGLKKVDLAGGPAQTLCEIPGFEAGANFSRQGATWSREDVIVFSAGGKLFRVPARGGEPEPLGKLAEGESGRYWPQFLPDGRHYLYLSIDRPPRGPGDLRRLPRFGPPQADRRLRVRRGHSPAGLPVVRQGRRAHGPALRRAAPPALRRAHSQSSTSWRSSRSPSPALARSTPFPPTECSPGARVPRSRRSPSN